MINQKIKKRGQSFQHSELCHPSGQESENQKKKKKAKSELSTLTLLEN